MKLMEIAKGKLPFVPVRRYVKSMWSREEAQGLADSLFQFRMKGVKGIEVYQVLKSEVVQIGSGYGVYVTTQDQPSEVIAAAVIKTDTVRAVIKTAA